MENKDYYSVKEIAQALNISRIAVFNKIKAGLIKAVKIGRMYAVPASEVDNLIGKTLTPAQKKIIDQGIKKTVEEYGETLRLLGKE